MHKLINDPDTESLIRKYLNEGVMIKGEYAKTTMGTPQVCLYSRRGDYRGYKLDTLQKIPSEALMLYLNKSFLHIIVVSAL